MWMTNTLKAFLIFLLLISSLFARKELCVDWPFDEKWISRRYHKRKESDPIRICVIVHNFGLNPYQDGKILDLIPGAFSLSLSPYNGYTRRYLQSLTDLGHNLLYIQPLGWYRQTNDAMDPYRVDVRHKPETNQINVERNLRLKPDGVLGIMVDEASPVLKDEETLKIILSEVKKYGLPIVSAEMAIDDDFRKYCEKEKIIVIEADYYITNKMDKFEIGQLLNRCEDLAVKTGCLLIAVDATALHVQEVTQWLAKFSSQPITLLSLKEYIDGCL